MLSVFSDTAKQDRDTFFSISQPKGLGLSTTMI